MPFAVQTWPFVTSGTPQFATDPSVLEAENTCKSTFWGNRVGSSEADLVYAWTPPSDGALNVCVHGTAAYILTKCSPRPGTPAWSASG